jgi:hypothetical protein
MTSIKGTAWLAPVISFWAGKRDPRLRSDKAGAASQTRAEQPKDADAPDPAPTDTTPEERDGKDA